MYRMHQIKAMKKLIAGAGALACFVVFAMLGLPRVPAVAASGDSEANKQIAELYLLQAAFHRATSGAGVNEAVKAEHVKDMLALWTEDGILVAGSVTYSGKGEPGTASCAPGSFTLCDLFTNHAGTFRLGNNWASLTPTYRTTFEVYGDTADVYWECHYFDVKTGVKEADGSIGLLGIPSSAQARKVKGRWLLSYAIGSAPPLSSE